jgi:hypothetical protein
MPVDRSEVVLSLLLGRKHRQGTPISKLAPRQADCAKQRKGDTSGGELRHHVGRHGRVEDTGKKEKKKAMNSTKNLAGKDNMYGTTEPRSKKHFKTKGLNQ